MKKQYLIESNFNFNIDIEKADPLIKTKNNIISQKKLYENIEMFADLGLPSGTIWARMNVGAFKSQDARTWYGNYYAWGELKTKNRFTQYLYKGKEENLQLTIENDIAYQKSNGLMKTASMQNYHELLDMCEESNSVLHFQYVINYNDISNLNGALFTSNINGDSLFFPFAGFVNIQSHYCLGTNAYMWTTQSHDQLKAYYQLFKDTPGYSSIRYFSSKYKGFSIRGIKINK